MDDDIRNRLQPIRQHHQRPYAPPIQHRPAPQPVIELPTQEHKPKKTKSRKPSKKLLVSSLAVILVAGVTSGGYWFYARPDSNAGDQKGVLSKSTTKSGLPIYTIANLPPDYTFNNDGSEIKTDVYFYTVTGPDGRKFYITQQRIPNDFDFRAFNQKFLQPDTFNTQAGSVVIGPVGATVLASVQTNKNTWILINTDPGTPPTQVSTVARSLAPPQE